MNMRRKADRRNRSNMETGHEPMDRDSDVSRDKLSEIMVALAHPWIERLGPAPPLPAVEFAYQACGLVWNVSRLSDSKKRQELFDKVSRQVAGAAPEGTEQEVSALVDMIYRRALVQAPEDRRIVVNMDIQDLGGGDFYVLVASARGAEEP